MTRAYVFDTQTKDHNGDNLLTRVIEADDNQELEEKLSTLFRTIEPDHYRTHNRRYRVVYAS